MQHILVATDGSSGGDRAIDTAAQLAKTVAATLSILTVAGTLSGNDIKRLAHTEGNVAAALELVATQILVAARERAQRLGVPAAKVQMGWGDPAQVILETAKHENADAIVIGRRGLGHLAGLLHGSVSQKVASLAPCVVMIVP